MGDTELIVDGASVFPSQYLLLRSFLHSRAFARSGLLDVKRALLLTCAQLFQRHCTTITIHHTRNLADLFGSRLLLSRVARPLLILVAAACVREAVHPPPSGFRAAAIQHTGS